MGCVLPAMGSELARMPDEVKSIVEDGLKALHAVWDEALHDRQEAWAVIAQSVGAVILARAVKSEEAQKEILRASRHQVEKLLNSKPGA